MIQMGCARALAQDLPAYPDVDLNHPQRSYLSTNLQEWSVWMEKELVVDHPLLASNALARLEGKLQEVERVLPKHSHPLLQERKIFLLLGQASRLGGKNSGADYFQRHAPAHFSNLDPRMASSIVIYSATNFVWLNELWALKVLIHEMAHAWQLEQWPESQPDILAAYQHALRNGLYYNVLGEQNRTLEKAYAITNQLEYFAELSCMYFAECNYFPRHRQELQAYDPVGCAMIRKMWNLGPEAINRRKDQEQKKALGQHSKTRPD
jgi:hypothetical protein